MNRGPVAEPTKEGSSVHEDALSLDHVTASDLPPPPPPPRLSWKHISKPQALFSRRSRLRELRTGHEWKGGVVFCFGLATFVLVLNVVLTIYAATKSSTSFHDVQTISGTVYQGQCSTARQWNTGIHFMINALSTLLLGASNYCMQSLGSPSREDIDRAHSRKVWLDIGIPSIRNLRTLGRRQVILWSLLALTSLPIHLLYNSTVFSTVGTNEYNVVIASSQNTSFPLDSTWTPPNYNGCFEYYTGLSIQDFPTTKDGQYWQRLSNQECISAYAVHFPSNRGDVIVYANITEDRDQIKSGTFGNSPWKFDAQSTSPFSWMCSGNPDMRNWDFLTSACSKGNVRADDWAISGTNYSFWTHVTTVSALNGSLVFNKDNYTTAAETAETAFPSTVDSDVVDTIAQDYLATGNPIHPSDLWADISGEYPGYDVGWVKDIRVDIQPRYACNREELTVGFLSDRLSHPYPDRALNGSHDGFDEIYDVYAIDHCLSKVLPENCQLLYSLPICIVVIVCNMVKVACMFMTVRDHRKHIFLRVGDAISSFLETPDHTTLGRCMTSKDSIAKGPQAWEKLSIFTKRRDWRDHVRLEKPDLPLLGRKAIKPVFRRRTTEQLPPIAPGAYPELLPRRQRWFRAVSWKRWASLISL